MNSPSNEIMYSPMYGRNRIKKNGQVATCRFAIASDINIRYIPYLFFFVSKNFSIKYIVHTNSINVTNCALAAIYGFII